MPATILELPVGSKAILTSYSSDSSFAIRLQEMGLIPGTVFSVIRKAPFGGPIEISFGHTKLAFRPVQNDTIFVQIQD